MPLWKLPNPVITLILCFLLWLKITECSDYNLLSHMVFTTTKSLYLYHLMTVQPPCSTHTSLLVTRSSTYIIFSTNRSFLYMIQWLQLAHQPWSLSTVVWHSRINTCIQNRDQLVDHIIFLKDSKRLKYILNDKWPQCLHYERWQSHHEQPLCYNTSFSAAVTTTHNIIH